MFTTSHLNLIWFLFCSLFFLFGRIFSGWVSKLINMFSGVNGSGDGINLSGGGQLLYGFFFHAVESILELSLNN